MNMKKTLVALAVAFGSTVALATPPVAPVVTSAPEAVVQKAEDGKRHEKREDRKGDRKEDREKRAKAHKEKMKNLTPEQFAEMKAKHLNMLETRKKILDNEIKCVESTKSAEDMKTCFKSAMQARKEVGLFPKHSKKHDGKKGDGVKREHRRDSLPDHPHVKQNTAIEVNSEAK